MKRVLKYTLLFLPGLLLLLAIGRADGSPRPPAVTSSAPAQVEPSIIYNPQTSTIEVKRPGAVVTLTDIYRALRDDRLLERTAPFEWELKVNLRIFEAVRLELQGEKAGGDVDWLKMKSDTSGFVSLESSNGQIIIRATRITSWDRRRGTFDTDFEDGRAFISAKNRSSLYTDNRMDVVDSEIAYLGHDEETAYGISWKVIAEAGAPNPGILGRGMTGIITGSKFHHNYIGVYVYGVGDMPVKNNEFYDNYSYGFDAHTYTRGVVVESNYSHDNGTHGIIFAELCADNSILRNRAINNRGHGIMLHELSTNNVVLDNEVTDNNDGVAIFESSNNTIARNIIRNNTTGVRIYGRKAPSTHNVFERNEISGSATFGVFMYDASANNTFRDNRIHSNASSGVYLKGSNENQFIRNNISHNAYGVSLDSADAEQLSRGNHFRDNIIENNRSAGIYSHPLPEDNVIQGNRFSGNGSEVRYVRQRVLSISGARILAVIGTVLVGVIVLVAVVSAFLIHRRSVPHRREGRLHP